MRQGRGVLRELFLRFASASLRGALMKGEAAGAARGASAPGGAYMALGRVWGSLAGALAAAEVIRLRWASLGKHTSRAIISGQPRQARVQPALSARLALTARSRAAQTCGAEMPRVGCAARTMALRRPPGGPEDRRRPFTSSYKKNTRARPTTRYRINRWFVDDAARTRRTRGPPSLSPFAGKPRRTLEWSSAIT